MGTALERETSIDPEIGFIMVRPMECEESASVNNAIATIYAKKGKLDNHVYFLKNQFLNWMELISYDSCKNTVNMF